MTNRRVVLPLISMLVGGCSAETTPHTLHVTGEYGRFGTEYLLRDCATDQEYSLTMPTEIFADFFRKSVAAGASMDETVLMTVDAASTPEQRYLYRVSKISNVRRGDCDSLHAHL